MRSYGFWTSLILSSISLTAAQAAEKDLLQHWTHGAYDKNIAAKRSVPSSSSNAEVGKVASADAVLVEAKAKAAAENKTIFLHFGASWCGWCKRLDSFLDRPDIQPVFEKYFVPVKLVVQENAKNKALKILELSGCSKSLEVLPGCRISPSSTRKVSSL